MDTSETQANEMQPFSDDKANASSDWKVVWILTAVVLLMLLVLIVVLFLFWYCHFRKRKHKKKRKSQDNSTESPRIKKGIHDPLKSNVGVAIPSTASIKAESDSDNYFKHLAKTHAVKSISEYKKLKDTV